ncbi:hypothetical protein EG329_002780 [Mollisiaceae sp. DMI_Dod_QoI]|nr:hypothetical protein EG329_002780 [Helotiales sp. DMI_Dod_QoI]
MTSLRPQDLDLLVSITKQVKSRFDFTEPAKLLDITTNAASQRWARLKTKILNKQDIVLKSGDEYILLVCIAKQFGAAEIDFDVVGDELGVSKNGANQRWGRLRNKIIGKNNPLIATPRLKPQVNKVTKAPRKARARRVIGPSPMEMMDLEGEDKADEASKEVKAESVASEGQAEENLDNLLATQIHEKRVEAESVASKDQAEENLDNLLATQIHEKRVKAVEQGYEEEEYMEEYVDADQEASMEQQSGQQGSSWYENLDYEH